MRLQTPLVLLSLWLEPLASESLCLKLDRIELDKGKYDPKYGGFSFVTVAVSETSVLLWMKSMRAVEGKRIHLSANNSISSVLCRCLLSSVYENLPIQDSNIAGFRCFNKMNEYFPSTVTSTPQLPAGTSSNISAHTHHAPADGKWNHTMQHLKRLYQFKRVVTHLKCVQVTSSEVIISTSKFFTGAILDVRTVGVNVYVLLLADSENPWAKKGNVMPPFTEEAFKHCGYIEDDLTTITPPRVARSDSDLEELYTPYFGSKNYMITLAKYNNNPSPCVFVEGNVDEYLAELRNNVSKRHNIELVAQLSRKMFFSLTGQKNYQIQALSTMREVMSHFKDTKAHLVSEMICDHASHLDKLPTNDTVLDLDALHDASHAAQDNAQDDAEKYKLCSEVTPENINICRRVALSGPTFGIITFSKVIKTSPSWAACFDGSKERSLSQAFGEICNSRTAHVHPGPNAANVLEAVFMDMLKKIFVGAETDNIFDALTKHELPNEVTKICNRTGRTIRKNINSSGDANKRPRTADACKGENVLESSIAIKEGSVIAAKTSVMKRKRSDSRREGDKRPRATDTSKQGNDVEGAKALTQRGDVPGEEPVAESTAEHSTSNGGDSVSQKVIRIFGNDVLVGSESEVT